MLPRLAMSLPTSPLFPADLIDFSLEVDTGSGPVEIFDEFDLNSLGGGDYDFDDVLDGLSNVLGDTNTVVATATFDLNNDGEADETRTATTFINGTDGSDILFA